MNMQALALHGHMKAVTMVKYNAEGDLIFSVAKEPKISVWYTKTGERLGTYDGHKSVAACDVNRTSTLLATAGFDLRTMLWEVETGDELATIEHLAPARATGFSHDDRILMCVTDKKMGQDGSIHLYNLPASLGVKAVTTKFNPFVSYQTTETKMAITFAEWGPTNDTIYFSCENGTVNILDVERMKVVQSAVVHTADIPRIRFDSNYYTLVSASKDCTAALLDSRNLHVIQRYQSDVPVNEASISPLADHVILGGGMEAQDVTVAGGTSKFEVKFYHKVHGDLLGQMKCHFGTINSVAFHPNGRSFATGAVDGFIKIHTLDENYLETPGATPVWPLTKKTAAKHAEVVAPREDEDEEAVDDGDVQV
jgi:translation initiation factor 3 subunit I